MLPLQTVDQLTIEIETLEPQLREPYSLRESNQLTDAETAAFYILRFMEHRLGKRCWGGKRNSSVDNKRPPIPFPFEEKNRLNLYLKNFHLAHLSPRVNESITHFLEGKWNFKLITHIPTPLEVLRYQSQGQRPVTMITDFELMKNFIHEEKDAPNFLLHDLAHGERFFHGSHKEAQIGLFRSLLFALEENLFTSTMERDPIFKEKLEYGIADMNSHPLHTLQYLKAIWVEHHLRTEGHAHRFPHTEEAFLQKMFWPNPVKELVRKINTPQFSSQEGRELENYFTQISF